jgi:hypothetical protein
MICESFKEDPYSRNAHEHPEDDKTYQIMFYNQNDESCANFVSIDELASLFNIDKVMANTFSFIGKDAGTLDNEATRAEIISAIEKMES